jgi:hypothetical protein
MSKIKSAITILENSLIFNREVNQMNDKFSNAMLQLTHLWIKTFDCYGFLLENSPIWWTNIKHVIGACSQACFLRAGELSFTNTLNLVQVNNNFEIIYDRK